MFTPPRVTVGLVGGGGEGALNDQMTLQLRPGHAMPIHPLPQAPHRFPDFPYAEPTMSREAVCRKNSKCRKQVFE